MKTLILGLGNPILGDDSVGLHVTQALEDRLNRPEITVMEGSVAGLNFLDWLAWHLTRVQDRAIADLTGKEQLWVKEEWHFRFDRPADPQDVGIGHSLEDLAMFRSPDVHILLAYHHAVLGRSKHYISNLSQTDLDREIDHPRYPKVGLRLVGIINDNLQHAGQVAYVHGLLKGKGWLDM